MIKAILQGCFVLSLIVGIAITEALLPFALPEIEAPNRFYHPDGLEGTLAGLQACMEDGRREANGRGVRFIQGHCTNGYAVSVNTQIAVSGIQIHKDGTCTTGLSDKPYRRFVSATLKNIDPETRVARIVIRVSAFHETLTNIVDIWLEPGSMRHRCLGVDFGFDTYAEAAHFDRRADNLLIEAVRIYGVTPQLPATPPAHVPFGRLPENTNI